MKPPLSGLKVLDFGQGIAGPYCAQLLGDSGAHVIKVEPPRGDWSREMGKRGQNGLSAAFLSVNRNKEGICLDLKSRRAVAVARELARRADVVVESFRPGVMDRHGLGYQQMQRENPQLIYASITGFGDSGPNAALPAGDSTMQAYGGLMSIVGEPGLAPLRVGNVVSDMIAGTNAFSGVCLALAARAQDGQGRRVSTSLLDSMVAFQAAPLSEYLLTEELPEPSGNQHPLISPSGAFQTSDGHIVLTVLAHQWRHFCEQMHLGHLCEDPRFATSSARRANRDSLNSEIARLIQPYTSVQALARLRAAGILCAPINTYADLVDDPQVQHNRLIDSADGLAMIRNPVRLGDSTEEQVLYGPPPAIGEHTRDVLARELGWDTEAVDEFFRMETAEALGALRRNDGDIGLS